MKTISKTNCYAACISISTLVASPLFAREYQLTDNPDEQQRFQTPVTRPASGYQASLPKILSLWLVDAGSDTLIEEITDGKVFDVDKLPDNITVMAMANDFTESVEFGFQGDLNYRVENHEPYSLDGDNAGNYNASDLAEGWHTVRARPYGSDGAVGSIGSEVLISFSIFEQKIEVTTSADGHDANPGDGICRSTVTGGIDDITYSTASENPQSDSSSTLANSHGQSATKASADSGNQHEGQLAGACTLRAAIEEANARAGMQSITAPTFNTPYKLSLGPLLITDGVTIKGTGSPVVDAQYKSRVLEITPLHPGAVVLTNLTFTHGEADAPLSDLDDAKKIGGGIAIDYRNESEYNYLVLMDDVTIEDNIAGWIGGGIYASGGGFLMLNESTVRGNSAASCADGGGVSGGAGISTYGNLSVVESTIHDNCGSIGSGIRISNANLYVLRSSIYDNEANTSGAGIYMVSSDGYIEDSTIAGNRVISDDSVQDGDAAAMHVYDSDLEMINATIVENVNEFDYREESVSGILNSSSTISIKNTVLANPGIHGQAQECIGSITSLDGNFIGESGNGCNINVQPSDIVDGGDPMLGNLNSSGYLLPQAASPLVDSGVAGCEDEDQRDLPAPVGNACDIGAVERQ